MSTVYEHAYVDGVNAERVIVARIAVTDGMADDAVSMLIEAGHEVDMDPAQLDGFDAVVIRSDRKSVV